MFSRKLLLEFCKKTFIKTSVIIIFPLCRSPDRRGPQLGGGHANALRLPPGVVAAAAALSHAVLPKTTSALLELIYS